MVLLLTKIISIMVHGFTHPLALMRAQSGHQEERLNHPVLQFPPQPLFLRAFPELLRFRSLVFPRYHQGGVCKVREMIQVRKIS